MLPQDTQTIGEVSAFEHCHLFINEEIKRIHPLLEAAIIISFEGRSLAIREVLRFISYPYGTYGCQATQLL